MERMSDERLAEIEHLLRDLPDYLRGGMYDELCSALKAERAEVMEQCRLNGMGSEREAKLLAEVERLRDGWNKSVDDWKAERESRQAAEALLDEIAGLERYRLMHYQHMSKRRLEADMHGQWVDGKQLDSILRERSK